MAEQRTECNDSRSSEAHGYSCPSCRGTMTSVAGEWVCQRPCGFSSHDSSPIAWAMLHGVLKLLRTADELAQSYAGVLPNSSIIADYLRRRADEEL